MDNDDHNAVPAGGSTTDAALDDELARLVAGMAARDEAALERFYDLTFARCYALATRIVRVAEAAEEVVEDTYWQAWRDAARYDAARGRVLTWLLTICRTRALDQLRRREPAEATEDVETAVAQSVGGDIDADVDPYRLLDALQRGCAVRAAVERLKPQVRQLVALAFFRGLTHQEIADASGIPIGTVKAALHRACAQMRETLAAEGVEVQHG